MCTICQQQFEEVTISSCFHTFCLACVQGQVSRFGGTNYHCPICKASVNLSGEQTGQIKNENYVADDTVVGTSRNTRDKTCDICSDDRMAINRCMQCEESLCQNCTNAHLKMKASRYHRQHVVPLAGQTGASDLERSMLQKTCRRHQNEEIRFVCKKCDVVLCLICKLLEHEHHVTKPISKEASDMRRRLNDVLQKQIGLGERLHIKAREIETKKMHYPLALDEEIAKLNNQASQMHTEIEHEKLKAEKELKIHYGDHLTKYEMDGGNMKRDCDEYRAMNEQVLQILNSNNDVYVVGKGMFLYERLSAMEDHLRNADETVSDKPTKRFQYGAFDSQQIQSMLGYVCENGLSSQGRENNERGQRSPEESSRSSTCEIKLKSRFVIPFYDGIGYVYGIAPVDQTKAWISLLDHVSVMLIDSSGTVMRSIDVGDVCEDVTTDTTGGCYVTCPIRKCIKSVKPDGQVEDIITQLGKVPHGISLLQHINTESNTTNNKLYVCLTDTRGPTIPLYDNQKGCVQVFSEMGEDFGRSCHLQAPVRLDVHVDSNALCVSDHSNGQVMISDMSGQLIKAIYTGENKQDLFKPIGVCFDKIGHVIVADWSGNRVSLISQDGTCIKTLVHDIEGPQSVACRDGMLWVGGKRGTISVYNMN